MVTDAADKLLEASERALEVLSDIRGVQRTLKADLREARGVIDELRVARVAAVANEIDEQVEPLLLRLRADIAELTDEAHEAVLAAMFDLLTLVVKGDPRNPDDLIADVRAKYLELR